MNNGRTTCQRIGTAKDLKLAADTTENCTVRMPYVFVVVDVDCGSLVVKQ